MSEIDEILQDLVNKSESNMYYRDKAKQALRDVVLKKIGKIKKYDFQYVKFVIDYDFKNAYFHASEVEAAINELFK